MAAYRHSLDLAYRDAGTVLGDDHRFIDKLLAGKPVTVGMLGASVAQNAGCLTQPGDPTPITSRLSPPMMLL